MRFGAGVLYFKYDALSGLYAIDYTSYLQIVVGVNELIVHLAFKSEHPSACIKS